ncbi:MAG: hypothetical protein JZU50_12540 [Desulfobulbaceae bacterium]|jgi:hypothetical protein|nr:hypothetical protein [Desulfobulbaceae bacterium]
MDLLAFIYQNGLWIAPPGFFLFALLLGMCIKSLLQTIRRSRLFSVPLLDRQEIEFAETGKVDLCLEGPLLSRRFAHLEYELTGPDGLPVKSRRVLFRTGARGFTKINIPIKVYAITQPGSHIFQLKGLGEAKPFDGEHRMVFMRPRFKRILLHVVGIVLAGSFLIGSLVLFLLRMSMGGQSI